MALSTGAQKLGWECYRREEYTKAIEHFDRAIKGSVVSVQLLDARASCHTKLGNLPAALKDAKQIIQLDRANPTGYLRAGKILKKMDKKSVALEIYAHGVKRVKHVGRGYEALRDAHDELMAELAPSKSVDPFTVLPRELGLAILECLDFRQRVGIMRVSKQWKTFICSEPRNWHFLDFAKAEKIVRTSFVSTAINTAKKRLTSAHLVKIDQPRKTIAAVFRHCPLEKLTLGGEIGFKDFCHLKPPETIKELRLQMDNRRLDDPWDHDDTIRGVCNFISRLSAQLQVLELPERFKHAGLAIESDVDWPELRDFVLRGYLIRNNLEHKIIMRARKLRSLTASLATHDSFPSLDDLPCLESLDVTLRVPLEVNGLQVPQTLRCLRVQTDPKWRWNTMSFRGPWVLQPWGVPNLAELSLSIFGKKFLDLLRSLEPREGQEASDFAGRLKRVALLDTQWGDGDDLAELSQVLQGSVGARLSGVTELTLTNDANITDDVLMSLVSCMPVLETLQVEKIRITGVAVRDIVLLRRLKSMRFVDCDYIGRDAIDWARKQGVQVTFYTTSGSGKGKKIRYE